MSKHSCSGIPQEENPFKRELRELVNLVLDDTGDSIETYGWPNAIQKAKDEVNHLKNGMQE